MEKSVTVRRIAMRYHTQIHFRLAVMDGKALCRQRQSPLPMNDATGRFDDDESAIAAADSLVVLHACPPDHQSGWDDCRRIGASKTKDTQNSDISASPSSPHK